MPYIPEEARFHLSTGFLAPGSPGELHFLIAQAVDRYLRANGLGYRTLNDVMGALACAQQEVYRRLAAPYEDRKLADNGDVFAVGGEADDA